jgi:hypothetical protein
VDISEIEDAIHNALLDLDSSNMMVKKSAGTQVVSEDSIVSRHVERTKTELFVFASPKDNEKENYTDDSTRKRKRKYNRRGLHPYTPDTKVEPTHESHDPADKTGEL